MKFGKGVWIDTDGNIIKPGQGRYDETTGIVTQYNTDGSKSGYTRRQWTDKQMHDNDIRLLQRDRKWAIPDTGKRVAVTLPESVKKDYGVRGMQVSENVLDSVAVNADRAGLPFKNALGLAVKESHAGNGRDKYGVGRGTGQSYLHWLPTIKDPKDKDSYWARRVSYKGVQSPTLLVSDWE